MRAPDENAAYTLERLQERAAKLISVLRERAIETTKERRIPEATIRDLWDADLFYLLSLRSSAARRSVPTSPSRWRTSSDAATAPPPGSGR